MTQPPLAPGVLAAFLNAERQAILELFTARARASIAPRATTTTELVDHLPAFLAELADVLEASTGTVAYVFAQNRSAQAHGRQRLRVGYELDALVREYGLLRDCIYERMELAGVTPSVREQRILSDLLSGAVAASVDEYVRARQTHAEAERRHLLGLFEQAPGFFCFLRGSDLVFELANAAYFQLVGHRDILDKPLREALPEVAGQGYFEILDGVLRTGEPWVGRGVRVMLQREPGAALSEAFVDLIYQPIRGADGAVDGVVAQGYDVTDRKRVEAERLMAEEALRASEERYRTLFESIDDGFCLIQMLFDGAGKPVDYRFLETNDAFEGHTGLANAVGKTARELVPGLDASWFERYGHVAVTGQPARFENHAPAMGRWFEVYANRVGKPELAQVALVFKDVTERKRVEEERERILARESAARRDAEAAGRLRDEFLATVSHELRTPLNAMLGWVQMLRTGALSESKRAQALETIERNARAQTQLIEDLLDVSGILAGKLRLDVQPVDVESVVLAALETVRPAADAKNIALRPALASGATVMGDPQRLQQVVWNLLSNAVKFTGRGGSVRVVVELRESSVEVVVVDSGVGIDQSFQPYVFDRFRQADGGTTRAHGGLGLGLAIARQLVEMQGGTVAVWSAGEGHGSTFTVRLPLAATRRAPPDAPRELTDAVLGSGFRCPPELDGLRLLVVDDEEDTREMLRTLLEGCGAEVRVAASAEEGFRAFREAAPDVLLSDVGMPGEDGYAFVRKIRRLAADEGGQVPAIALTAYARAADRTRALLAGFTNHVAKPVEPLELVCVVASLTRRPPRPT